MALGSQMAPRGRGGGSFSPGRRRRRGRPKKVLALVAVGVLAWVGFSWAFDDSAEDADSAPAPDAVAVDDRDADARPGVLPTGRSGEPTQQPDADAPSSAAAGLTGSGSQSRSANLEPFVPTPPRSVSGTRASDDRDAASDSAPAAERRAQDEAVAAAEQDRAETLETQPRTSTSATARRSQSRSEGRRLMERGQSLYEDGKLVDAREALNDALNASDLSRSDARDVRDLMAEINETLIFSPRVVPDDPYVSHYEVQSGDALSRIAPQYNVPWQFIAKINGDLDPNRIRAGQRLKVVNGPFHVVVDKRDYRLDVYLGEMYVRSFDVGLGEHDMTPVGDFIVRRGKLTDPEWTNPRTGQRFLPDDPENPLGGYWIGIRGTTPETEVHTGYGIHGTIEPETIGTDASMGCIRLRPEDVAILYTMLTEEQSHVRVLE